MYGPLVFNIWGLLDDDWPHTTLSQLKPTAHVSRSVRTLRIAEMVYSLTISGCSAIKWYNEFMFIGLNMTITQDYRISQILMQIYLTPSHLLHERMKDSFSNCEFWAQRQSLKRKFELWQIHVIPGSACCTVGSYKHCILEQRDHQIQYFYFMDEQTGLTCLSRFLNKARWFRLPDELLRPWNGFPHFHI